jgi:putative mRNA 3-end processing factor
MSDLLITTEEGLYCPAGDFYIDPWGAVRQAIITHAHADHAREGSEHYLTAREGFAVLQHRLGPQADIQTLEYGEPIEWRGVTISLHPAGHILGSAQVRLEHAGEVWVVTGDYKLAPDPTCRPFELLTCHTLVTESTFGLPIYRWRGAASVWDEINAWWRRNVEAGIASLVLAYSLGKAQRILRGVDASLGPIYCHGAIEQVNRLYRASGVSLPATTYTGLVEDRSAYAGALVIAPISARGTLWLRRLGEFSSAMASGWMQVRGARRRRGVDRGFALSDHADWSGLIDVVRGSGAQRVLVTHGFVEPMVQWLREQGWQAEPLRTEFRGELEEEPEPDANGPNDAP